MLGNPQFQGETSPPKSPQQIRQASKNNQILLTESKRNKSKSNSVELISENESPEQRIDNIGIDGSQRFSDIQLNDGKVNSTQESLIVFNPRKESEGI